MPLRLSERTSKSRALSTIWRLVLRRVSLRAFLIKPSSISILVLLIRKYYTPSCVNLVYGRQWNSRVPQATLLADARQVHRQRSPEQLRSHLHWQVLRVVGVPDPDSSPVLQDPVVAFRTDANGLEGSGRGLHLLFAFHVRLHGYRFVAIVERKAVGSALLQGQAGHIKNARHYVGYAAGNVVLRFLLLIVFEVSLLQHSLAAAVVKCNDRFPAMRTLLGVLRHLGRAKALGVEIRIETVLDPVQQRDHASGVGGSDYMFLRA